MNKAMFIGNLTKDPEIRSTQSGLKTASFSLAINDGKDKNGQEQVQYFNFSAFDKKAELFEKYVKKGHKVMIVGRIKNESWDKPDGTKGYGVKIMVDEIELITSKAEADRIASSQPTDFQPPVTNKKNQDLPEIDISNINVQMPF
jgi:single-strand DNA-binding protein